MPRLRLPGGPLEGELLILDKDGVLLDFHHLWDAVVRARVAALVAASGLELAEELLPFLGLDAAGRVAPGSLLAVASRHESMLAAATRLHMAGLPWAEARAAAEHAYAEADRAIDRDALTRPLPGVVEAIPALAAAGWKLAIATTDRAEGAWHFLRLSGLAPYFTSVVGADRVVASKPATEMVELVCAESGVAPSRAIVVGDGELDLRMARAAGAAGAIGVLCGIGEPAGLGPLADALVPDLRSLAQLS